MKPLSACVVGYGHLGRHHALKYLEIENTELVAVSDINPDALKDAESLGVETCTDYSHLLDKVDLASIATTTETHLEVARDFLEAGVPVLVEKPLASSLEDARVLAELAREKGVALQVGHIERFNPAVVAAEKFIHNPLFIEADRVSPFSFRSIDVGVVMDIMIHDIDLVLHLVKSPVREVRALGVGVLCETEDIANASIVFENGCTANVTASRVAIKTERKFRIFQKDAYISLDFAAQKVQVFRKKKDFSVSDINKLKEKGGSPLELMLANYIGREQVVVEEYDQLRREIESFVVAVLEKGEPLVTGEDAVEAIRVAEDVIESLKNPPWAK